MSSTHNILSARYAEPEPVDGYAANAAVIAIHAVYGEQQRHANDDNDGGGILAYLAEGGTIGPYQPKAITDDVKASLIARINDDAERYRQKFITPGDGMAMTYREKFEQAKAVVAAGQPAADALTDGEAYDAYPTLFASVGREAPSLWECALLVIARAEAWADLSHDIEAKRMDGKAAIEAASTVADAESAYASITWE